MNNRFLYSVFFMKINGLDTSSSYLMSVLKVETPSILNRLTFHQPCLKYRLELLVLENSPKGSKSSLRKFKLYSQSIYWINLIYPYTVV